MSAMSPVVSSPRAVREALLEGEGGGVADTIQAEIGSTKECSSLYFLLRFA